MQSNQKNIIYDCFFANYFCVWLFFYAFCPFLQQTALCRGFLCCSVVSLDGCVKKLSFLR